VFNSSLGQFQVASELTRTHGRKPSSGGSTRKAPTSCSIRQPGLAALAIACALASAGTWAAPGDGGGSYFDNESRGGNSGQSGASVPYGGAAGSGGSAGVNVGPTTHTNADSILGGTGGGGGSYTIPGGGGGGGIGVVMASGGTLINQGSISGGNGGNGGVGYAGAPSTTGGGGGGGGHGVSGGNLSLINAGTISA